MSHCFLVNCYECKITSCLNININHPPNRWNSKYKYIIHNWSSRGKQWTEVNLCFTYTSVFSPKKAFASVSTSVIFPSDLHRSKLWELEASYPSERKANNLHLFLNRSECKWTTIGNLIIASDFANRSTNGYFTRYSNRE